MIEQHLKMHLWCFFEKNTYVPSLKSTINQEWLINFKDMVHILLSTFFFFVSDLRAGSDYGQASRGEAFGPMKM